MLTKPLTNSRAGLILTGGGARAAYQVGVLKAIREMRSAAGLSGPLPFRVLAGTSAGAINATALASRADDFDGAIDALHDVWSHFSAEQVYRADAFGVIRSGARWLTLLTIGWALARLRSLKPQSLLDNSPLRELLETMVPLARLPEMLRARHIDALAISAFSYTSGHHITFYDARHDVPAWERHQRMPVRDRITYAHLLASSAIPFVFPAVSLGLLGQPEYFGDGSMRQVAPISPAIHLGANRLLVIGAGRMHEPRTPPPPGNNYPSLAQIAGHALSNIFLDTLATDVERLQRINGTLHLMTPEQLKYTQLRPIDLLLIAPSRRLDDLATEHLYALPVPVRAMLGALGVSSNGRGAQGSAFASYLLFEAPYTNALIKLGEDDAWAKRTEIATFFGWPAPAMKGIRR